MYLKSDNDNRSNQMNPNNDAYYSSRSVMSDDDEGSIRSATNFSLRTSPNTYATYNYYVAYLCLTGEQRTIKFGIKIETIRVFDDRISECDNWAIGMHQETMSALLSILI